MTEVLLVELYGTVLGTISGAAKKMLLEFTDEARQRWGASSPILSCALPIGSRAVDVSSFVANLLPDNEHLRAAVGLVHGVHGEDFFGLIGAIGMDCAGAVRIGTETRFAEARTVSRNLLLSDADVAELIRALPRRPMGAAANVRVSLGGAQAKLLLARTPDGWAMPVDGAPSTHILKPEPLDMTRGYAANEAFCMGLAQRCNLTTVASGVVGFQGWDTFVVERYDREVDVDGHVTRLHQEDFCQAHGRFGVEKYEAVGESRLGEMALTLNEWARRSDGSDQLLRCVVFHVVIGNADAHDKNFGLLHRADGSVQLAPMYDATSTMWRASTIDTLASSVNSVKRIEAVTAGDFIVDGKAWRVRRAEAVVADILERISVELASACLDSSVDEEMVGLMQTRCSKLLNQIAGP